MVKLKDPLMSAEAHGALGGIEYRQGIYGPMCGRRSIASAQSSPAQLAHRARLISAHRAWEALSNRDRAAWETLATPPATGRNTYIPSFFRLQWVDPTFFPLPIRHSSRNYLSNFDYETHHRDPWELDAFWDYQGDGTAYQIGRTHASYRNDSYCSPSRLRLYVAFPYPSGYLPITGLVNFPTVWVQIDMIDEINGLILGSWKKKYRPDYPHEP